MNIEEVLSGVRDALTVKRVFGEPYEKDGMTIIPAAVLRGGGGGGQGPGPEEGKQAKGSGSGFGLKARPVGVYVIKGDSVRYRPAVDVNRVILGAQVVTGLALLTLRMFLKVRGRQHLHLARLTR
jgi:uncharacterized spore protein YtfJ